MRALSNIAEACPFRLAGRIAAINLTRNEEVQIERAIRSVQGQVDEVFVIDSLSTDKTVAIARSCGATVFEHEFVSYADQVNWAIAQLPENIEWVLRLDADEYIGDQVDLRIEIHRLLDKDRDIAGVLCRRSIVFMEKYLRFGGMHKKSVLRLFRKNDAWCDSRLVDEHIRVQGSLAKGDIDIIDHDLKGIGFWVDKHNRYADLEARQYLKEKEFRPLGELGVTGWKFATFQQRKRRFYYVLPPVIRPLAYFFYRYVALGGFLDGYPGLCYSVLQAFWYRFLVEVRIREYQAEAQDIEPQSP